MPKSAKQKKILIISACILAVIAVLIFVLKPAGGSKTAEIYSFQRQTVQLFPDGSFSASLAHNVRKTGSYTKTPGSDRIVVLFNVNGRQEVGLIMNNSLYIPREWDDGHGHGNVFPRQNH